MARTHFGLITLAAALHVARPAFGEPEAAAGRTAAASPPTATSTGASTPAQVPDTARTATQAAREEPSRSGSVASPEPPNAVPENPADPAPTPSRGTEARAAGAPLTAAGGVGAPPTEALVHLAVNYTGARLETRSLVDAGEWRVLCDAPCDRVVHVEGEEMRVAAPGMTSSNAFLVAPGSGTARFRVSGGSATARTVGIIGLAGGLPITFAGVSVFGLGSVHGDSAERTAGLVTLVVGAVITLASLPCLLAGSTSVKNEHGRYIAGGAAETPLF